MLISRRYVDNHLSDALLFGQLPLGCMLTMDLDPEDRSVRISTKGPALREEVEQSEVEAMNNILQLPSGGFVSTPVEKHVVQHQLV